jgi:FAD/FMN-containing dehydrogenase
MTAHTLPNSPSGIVTVTPADDAYRALRSTYTTQHRPAEILLPADAEQVGEALLRAGNADAPLSVRSGGHGLSGRSSNDGGTVVDLSRIADVQVLDADTGLVRVGAGARWAQVAAALAPHELAISAGDHGGVGVGGLATAGGIGWMVRKHGLTIDNIDAATVVLADGSIVRTDAEHEPDLFWAVRGAGSFVGIVTDLDIRARHVPSVLVGQVAIEIDRAGAALRRWSEFMADARRDLTMTGVLGRAGRHQRVLVLTAVVIGNDPNVAEQMLRPLQRWGGVHTSGFQPIPYAGLLPLAHLHPNVGQNPVATTNLLLPRLNNDAASALAHLAADSPAPFIQLRALGGAANDVDPTATAYAHRNAELLVTVAHFPPAGVDELSHAMQPLWPHALGAYRNFESHPDRSTFDRAFPGATGERVARLSTRYDPDGLFRREVVPAERLG